MAIMSLLLLMKRKDPRAYAIILYFVVVVLFLSHFSNLHLPDNRVPDLSTIPQGILP